MPELPVTLNARHDEGDFDLVIGDAFTLELSFDENDDRWYLWTIRYGNGREGVAVEGDRKHGEPLPYGSLVELLGSFHAPPVRVAGRSS